MKFWETKRFKELEGEWEARLEASGFKDAEKKLGDGRGLKQFSSNAYRQAKHEAREGRLAYYEILHECFVKETFLDHKIMSEFVAGKKRAEIHRDLVEAGHDIEYETVRFIIRRYEYRWGIKNYTPKQMNLKKLPIR